MPKLLILSKHADEYCRSVEAAKLPELELVVTSTISEAVSTGTDCEIVFGEPALIRELLPALTDLRWVQATWAGVEPLLDPSLRRDYTLTNARSVFGGLMSEYVFGYLLMFERRILERRQAQTDHHWDTTVTGTLRGKTIGLLGTGSIGAHLAGTAKHFSMTVRGYTRASQSCPAVDAFYHGDELLDFASGLDYLVNTLPSTSETQHIVDSTLLDTLPAHAIFFNVGRSSTVDEMSLIKALESGKVAGAVLDVFEQEPLPKAHPYWTTPNLWITFHTAAPSFPADITKIFVENYHRFIKGEALNYHVDFTRGY
jgi:phosphoglycerate dehydrogenase-like enzyme